MTEIALLDRPHAEAARLVSGGAPVYLAINPVEYHGPHLPLHTDRIISEGLIADLHARFGASRGWPLLTAGDLELGFDPVPGPGTRPARYGDLKSAVLRACTALADLGAKRVVLMTFHGSPLHNLAIDAGARLLASRKVAAFAPLNLLFRELMQLTPAKFSQLAPAVAHLGDDATRQALLAELSLDFHAGFFETSLMLHYAPASVAASYRTLAPCPRPVPPTAMLGLVRLAKLAGATSVAEELGFAAEGLGWYQLRPFPGYTGRPAEAHPDSGRFFAEHISQTYAEHAEAVLMRGEAPVRPILRWLPWVTLGGRVLSPKIPREQMLLEPTVSGQSLS